MVTMMRWILQTVWRKLFFNSVLHKYVHVCVSINKCSRNSLRIMMVMNFLEMESNMEVKEESPVSDCENKESKATCMKIERAIEKLIEDNDSKKEGDSDVSHFCKQEKNDMNQCDVRLGVNTLGEEALSQDANVVREEVSEHVLEC